MADDEFAATVRSAVRDVFTSGKISTPISSMDLLLSLIALKPTTSLSHHLRLTDLHRLEVVLEGLSSRSWEHGSLSLSREGGVLTITDVHFGNAMADMVYPRKRKRPPVDEEADSAAGDDADEHSSRSLTRSPPPSVTPLANLGKELREVYAILQRATAKGRLMAERVCGRIPVMRGCEELSSTVLRASWELQSRLLLHHERGLCQGT
jgi:mRNA (2'-O-methyladenosine-N6-)-methyltransferase